MQRTIELPLNKVLRHTILAFCVASVSTRALGVADPRASNSRLIDDLTRIDSRSLGIDGAAVYEGFMVDDGIGVFQMGVLGVAAPRVAPQMKELVRRGPEALPELIDHLTDARPTQLAVGNDDSKYSTHQVGIDTFMFSYFSDEYDSPLSYFRNSKELETQQKARRKHLERNFQGRYTIKVGDVCFVLIRQIVNRRFLAVRYQPSAGLVVNSPVEIPSLAERVRNDWSGKDVAALEASLLADIRLDNHTQNSDWNAYATQYIQSALPRLRQYFPDVYRSLEGDDLEKRRQFEKDAAHPG